MLDLVAELGLALMLGLVLGYLVAMPRVKVLEKKVRVLEMVNRELEKGNWLQRESRKAMARSLEQLERKEKA
jgi:ABC-type antimicrobial peptide transport system permease subunit